MTTAEQLLIDTWRVLSTDKQQQVVDFVKFLRAHEVATVPETQTHKRRRMAPPELIGSVKILGDVNIISPIVDEEDWECLKDDWEIG